MSVMRLYALKCGGDIMDLAACDPFDPDVGTKFYNPYFFYVITHPQGTVIFDCGVHPALASDPASRLGDAYASFEVQISADDHVEKRLATIGMKPQDIDVVVQSHLHFDHCGGLAWLKHAPVLVQREELAFALNPPVYQRELYVRNEFDIGLNFRELDGDHDVFGDGRVVAVSTPGHTRGHQSLLVRLAGQTIFLLADASYLLRKIRARRVSGVVWSPDAMVASYERIEEIESAENARLMTTHEPDYETSVRMAPDEWYE